MSLALYLLCLPVACTVMFADGLWLGIRYRILFTLGSTRTQADTTRQTDAKIHSKNLIVFFFRYRALSECSLCIQKAFVVCVCVCFYCV